MDTQTAELAAGSENAGQRVDAFIALALEGQTRSSAQRLIETGNVLVNGAAPAKSHKLKNGDRVSIFIPPPAPSEAAAQDIPLKIVYEDDDMLIIDKPKGMVVHPAAGNPDGTLVNALLWHCGERLSGIGGVMRPGIVHRIDKDTSGLLAVAKTDHAHRSLSAQIKEHSFTRRYHGVVYGRLKNESGLIDAPIGRHPIDRKKMCVTERNSRRAVTRYRIEEYLDGFTYAIMELETGRTHQIRVHMAHIGHPLAGDGVYGPGKAIESLSGQCLHAGTLGFIHPVSGDYMEFTSPLPEYFIKFLRQKRKAV